MKILSIVLLCISAFSVHSQDIYFPPNGSYEWETIDQSTLGWNKSDVDELIDFCDTTGTKGLIILKDGKIVLEQYFGDFDQNKVWYWASAGKSLISVLIGMAQKEGKLSIEDPSNKYLGVGWTKMEQTKEDAIKIKHQLSMSTGIDYNVSDKDCLEPDCLDYLNEPGTHWYYHNAPYRLLQNVLIKIYGISINSVTSSLISPKIGMTGLWIDYVRWSKVRDMARFGLLISAKGKWKEEVIIEEEYYNMMINSSQEMNPAYGLLWWLNGKDKYRLPSLEFDLQGSLIKSAPNDMLAALGKNDQKIYIVPSEGLVIVRMGESGGESLLAASNYDEKLWVRLSKLLTKSNINTTVSVGSIIYPNPSENELILNKRYEKIEIFDLMGKLIFEAESIDKIGISKLQAGSYFVVLKGRNGEIEHKQTILKIN